MRNYFRGTEENPNHLSVGAVLCNEKKEICAHYFQEYDSETYRQVLKDFYILMRETIELGESIEQALARGLKEEFGATGKIVKYLGSLKTQFYRGEIPIEKTTLYFFVELENIDESLRAENDDEAVSELRWHKPEFLIERMKEQGIRYPRLGIDESAILQKL